MTSSRAGAFIPYTKRVQLAPSENQGEKKINNSSIHRTITSFVCLLFIPLHGKNLHGMVETKQGVFCICRGNDSKYSGYVVGREATVYERDYTCFRGNSMPFCSLLPQLNL
jgi:hypothetical protein